MIWLKSAFTGLVAAIITLVAIIVATTSWHVSAGAGSGGVGFVSVGLSSLLLFPAALAFALGFMWMFQRQRRLSKSITEWKQGAITRSKTLRLRGPVRRRA